jgi:hypothetical protein
MDRQVGRVGWTTTAPADLAHRSGENLSRVESLGSAACVKLRLCVVKSPDISLRRGVACARFAQGVPPAEEVQGPPCPATVERLLGEGPIKQYETTHAGAGA